MPNIVVYLTSAESTTFTHATADGRTPLFGQQSSTENSLYARVRYNIFSTSLHILIKN